MKQELPDITIRPYRATDKQNLRTCIEDLQDYFVSIDVTGTFTRKPAYGRIYGDYVLNEVKKHNGVIYVVTEGKKMIAFIAGAIYKQTKFDKTYTTPKRTGWVLLLYVDAAYRKQKIGTVLMDKIEDYFAKNGCESIRLEAVGSHSKPYAYYKRRGYRAWAVDMIKPINKTS
jgi:GNAT superfamily N-acetyltransferase